MVTKTRYTTVTTGLTALRDIPFFIDHVCSTVSSMLSGLETRSLGLNTLGTT